MPLEYIAVLVLVSPPAENDLQSNIRRYMWEEKKLLYEN